MTSVSLNDWCNEHLEVKNLNEQEEAMSTAEKHMWLESHGYSVRVRKEFENRFPEGLKERMARYDGKYIVLDFEDGEDGFCLVGDNLEELIGRAYEAAVN